MGSRKGSSGRTGTAGVGMDARVTGVGPSSSSGCCHSYPDPGRDLTDTNSVLLAYRRNTFESNRLICKIFTAGFSQMLRKWEEIRSMGENDRR